MLKTGELVAPKNWNVLKRENDSDKFLMDFRVPSPFKVDRQCTADSSGKPMCQKTNIFHNDELIVEDTACCCKGDYCADVLFDQSGFNPAPFILIETDESERINNNPTPTNSKPNKPKKLSFQDQSGAVGDVGFDWSFSPIETAVIIFVVIIIIIIVISMGLWFVYEREKAAEKVKNDTIQHETSVFSIDEYPFALEKNGKRLF
uniref:Uncharacterized protein n=1 Tax=Panagrolaimus davidi TaxID=227884 RepID=A0A914PKA3_9BILA